MDTRYWLIVAALIIMGWFAWGMISNLRCGDRMIKWMRQGLSRISPKSTFRWLGTSVVEMVIHQGKRPFRRLDTLLVLAPRDVFWMMLSARLQRREDFLIFRAHLHTPPLVDLELADPRTWSGNTALKQAQSRNWEGRDYGNLRLMAPHGLLDLATQTLEQLAQPMQALSGRYIRFSLRRQAPHLEIHLPFPDTAHTDAQAYFEALRALGQRIGER